MSMDLINDGDGKAEDVHHDLDRDVVDDADVRRKAHKWCKDSICGSWAKISEADLILKPVTGGMSNYLYLCCLPENVLTEDKEPRTVLLRIYGHIAKTSREFVVHNSVIFALLSEKGLGPKLYGIYHDGRVEEYIPTRCLLREEIRRGDISSLIALKLAQSHGLDMPLCKEPSWLRQTTRKWLEEIKNNIINGNIKNDDYKRKIHSFNLDKEFKKILQMMESTDSPVVFCHNDLQEGNILYWDKCEDKSKQLTLIDWEYCSYNYRGFDLANHFCEWSIDYTAKEQPHFSYHPNDFPKKEQQLMFLREYLEAQIPGDRVTDVDLEAIFVEVNTFVPVSHFFWGVWAIIEAQTSCINFGYADYAICRLECYFSTKEKLEMMMDSRVD